jgi:hypothetical protein
MAVMMSMASLIFPCFSKILAVMINVSKDYGSFFNIICARSKAFYIVYSLSEYP